MTHTRARTVRSRSLAVAPLERAPPSVSAAAVTSLRPPGGISSQKMESVVRSSVRASVVFIEGRHRAASRLCLFVRVRPSSCQSGASYEKSWLADRQGGLLLPSLLPDARRDIQADRYMRVTKQICEILEPSNYSVIINLPIHRDCLCARPTPSLRQFRPISPGEVSLRCSF